VVQEINGNAGRNIIELTRRRAISLKKLEMKKIILEKEIRNRFFVLQEMKF